MKQMLRLLVLISVGSFAYNQTDATDKNLQRLAIVAGVIGGSMLTKIIYNYFQTLSEPVVELPTKDILKSDQMPETKPIKISSNAKKKIDDIFDLKSDYYAINKILNSSSKNEKLYFGYKALAAIIEKKLFNASFYGISPATFLHRFNNEPLLFAWRMFIWHAFTDKNFFKKYFCNQQNKIDWDIIDSYGLNSPHFLQHLSGYPDLSFLEYCMLRGYTDFLPAIPIGKKCSNQSGYFFCLTTPGLKNTNVDLFVKAALNNIVKSRNSEDIAVLCKCLCANKNLDKNAIIAYLNCIDGNTFVEDDKFEWWFDKHYYLPSAIYDNGTWSILEEHMNFDTNPFQDIASKTFNLNDKFEIFIAFEKALSKIKGWEAHRPWFWKKALAAIAEYASDEDCCIFFEKVKNLSDFTTAIEPKLKEDYGDITSECVNNNKHNMLLLLKELFPALRPFKDVKSKKWQESTTELIVDFMKNDKDRKFDSDYRRHLKEQTTIELVQYEEISKNKIRSVTLDNYSDLLLISELYCKRSYYTTKIVAADLLEKILAQFTSVTIEQTPQKNYSLEENYSLVFSFAVKKPIEIKFTKDIFDKYFKAKDLEQILEERQLALQKSGIVLPEPRDTIGSFCSWLTGQSAMEKVFKTDLHAQRKELSLSKKEPNGKLVPKARRSDIIFTFTT